ISEHTQHLQKLQPGQSIQLLKNENNTLEQLIVALNPQENLIISRDDDGYSAYIDKKEIETRKYFRSATIEHSLYRSAKQAGIPNKITFQLSQIFAWRIDFSTELRPGDRFSILYEAHYTDNKRTSVGNIIAAKFINQNDTYTAFRYTNPEGNNNYYTDEGENTQKALLRYPIDYSHISSSFKLDRMHPILGEVRAHKGVDLAAALGTPIKAIGDGKITYIGNNGGYGNMVKIAHTNGEYESFYAHMLRFNENLSKGSAVKQGQTIGYVGQSGLATGPHVHFELIKDREAIDPITAKLPQADPIDNDLLDNFLITSHQLMTQLDRYAEMN
ncbi:MAG: peptidoglycan DD-metalloendopeptidase family protein, partial [Gammaproteobacteria bacterium]